LVVDIIDYHAILHVTTLYQHGVTGLAVQAAGIRVRGLYPLPNKVVYLL